MDGYGRAVAEFFGFLKVREKTRNVRYYQKTIKRMRRKLEYADKYLDADELLSLEKDAKKRKLLLNIKSKSKKSFRKIS